MKRLPVERLVFLDESGFTTALGRHYGWAPQGRKPVIITPNYGKHLTLMGAIAVDGVRALTTVEETLDGPGFVRFLEEDLGPHLRPGDIVVMDGPRLHRVAGVSIALAKWQATPLYLPPYSPELNPIEMCWAFMKAWVRTRAPRVVDKMLDAIAEVWGNVTAGLCEKWVGHSGYATGST